MRRSDLPAKDDNAVNLPVPVPHWPRLDSNTCTYRNWH